MSFLNKLKNAGSVESTFAAIQHALKRLVLEDPSLLEKDEELATKLIESRWGLKKYKEEILNKSSEEGKINFKKLYISMLSHEYDPPLQYKLSSNQKREFYDKIYDLVDKGFK